ncbi:MAG TPA: class I SAM-dependent methyltransferase [Ilumatobacteraceae bacterium]|nr:class I SAM-dependent methyltransferase [Ilumatobacteraceae bacterium]
MPIPAKLRRSLAALSGAVPPRLRSAARPVARRLGLAAAEGDWWLATTPPWVIPADAGRSFGAWCIICRWTGERFLGREDGESADCPRCRSIARDRFLFWCFLTRTPDPFGMRVLETSPRLGEHYRERMRRWFDYTCSDFDSNSHRSELDLDLQAIDLPSNSLDVILTPHVLEHVPDTALALTELFRVLKPGGRMYLQVPLVYGRTSVPVVPEFHEDNTPVCFNFGWDLTDLLRDAGFDARVLVPAGYSAMLHGRHPFPPSPAEGFHVDELAADVRLDEIETVIDDEQATWLGIRPPYHFSTWEAIRPPAGGTDGR